MARYVPATALERKQRDLFDMAVAAQQEIDRPKIESRLMDIAPHLNAPGRHREAIKLLRDYQSYDVWIAKSAADEGAADEGAVDEGE